MREGEGGTEKWCSSCSEWKPTDEFRSFIGSGGKPRLYPSCRVCERVAWRVKDQRRRDAVLARTLATGTKFCTGCDRELPIDEFSRNRQASDGRQNECRECKSIRAQQERLDASFFVCGPAWTEDEADWKQLAGCKDLPAEWWLDSPYTTRGIKGQKGGTETVLTANAVRAKRVCAECPVIEKCRALNDAIEIGISRNAYIGLWAGETIPERMERRRREAVHAA